jgi:hypothetical protein
MLIAKIARARRAGRDLRMVISISPMNDLIECGIDLISSTNSDPESLRPIFAEIGKWLRAYFVGTTGVSGGLGVIKTSYDFWERVDLIALKAGNQSAKSA